MSNESYLIKTDEIEIDLRGIKVKVTTNTETMYAASLYVDGKRTLVFGQNGDIYTWQVLPGKAAAARAAKLDKYIASLPGYEFCGITMQPDLNSLIFTLRERKNAQVDMKAYKKHFVLWTTPDLVGTGKFYKLSRYSTQLNQLRDAYPNGIYADDDEYAYLEAVSPLKFGE